MEFLWKDIGDQSGREQNEVLDRRDQSSRAPLGRKDHFRSRNERDNLGRDRDRDLPRLRGFSLDVASVVGKFRAVAQQDLERFLTQPGRSTERTIRELRDKKILRTVWLQPGVGQEKRRSRNRERQTVPSLTVMVLTKYGKDVLLRSGYDESLHGKLWPGIPKEREAFHDSRLFAMTQMELAKLAQKGYSQFVIITDNTLKSRLFKKTRELSRTLTAERAREQAASEYNISIQQGRFVLPDVRVEFIDDRGDPGRVDLEFVSESYSKEAIQTKKAAGYTGYAARSSRSSNGDYIRHGRPGFDEHDLLEEIFTR